MWAENRWPDRETTLRAYLRTAARDILALQELRQATRDVLDKVRNFFLEKMSPSDHKPLTVTYGLEVDGNE